MKWFAVLLALALFKARAATFTEDFSQEPSAWRGHQASAFSWDSLAQNLRVTWDSREPNSFFYWPLPWTLTRAENFAAKFTLRFDDVQLGIDPTKTETFPIALGFLNITQATRPDYFRGSGVNALHGARSIVEFAYFPDGGLEPTIGPIIASTNNQISFAHTHPVELAPGVDYRVEMRFEGATLNIAILRDGAPVAEIRPVTASRGDFRVDAFSIHSYNDSQQSPPQFAGSVLAHGTIDDVEITYPDPPIQRLSLRKNGGAWAVEFAGRAGWNYRLQRSVDFSAWSSVVTTVGVDGTNTLIDPDPPSASAAYRVEAFRP